MHLAVRISPVIETHLDVVMVVCVQQFYFERVVSHAWWMIFINHYTGIHD
jgi:hypothetical protein